MRIENKQDFWSGLMFVGIGTAFVLGSSDYEKGTSMLPGPGFLPNGLGTLLALIGAAVTIKSLAFSGSGPSEPDARWSWKALLLVLGAASLFGFLLPRVGLFVALPILFLSGSLASKDVRWKEAAIGATVITLGSHLLFNKGLNLMIPTAFLGMGH